MKGREGLGLSEVQRKFYFQHIIQTHEGQQL